MAVRTLMHESAAVRAREAEVAVPEVLTGAAAAALGAAGIGSFVFGLAVALAEMNPGLADRLNLVNPVGPLSGKVVVGILGWLLSWMVLGAVFKGKDPAIGKVFAVSLVLILLGMALTFPPVFELLAGG